MLGQGRRTVITPGASGRVVSVRRQGHRSRDRAWAAITRGLVSVAVPVTEDPVHCAELGLDTSVGEATVGDEGERGPAKGARGVVCQPRREADQVEAVVAGRSCGINAKELISTDGTGIVGPFC